MPLPYTFNSKVNDPIIDSVLQEMWQQLAGAINRVPDLAFKPPIINQVRSSISGFTTLGGGFLDASSIDPATIHGELAISLGKLGVASKGIDTQFLADLAVEAAQLDTNAVTATKINALAVGAAAIQALAVGTAHIENAAITNAKVASMSVAKLTAGTATFTGAVNFNSASDVGMLGGGNLNITPGGVNCTDLNVKSAGSGWDMTPGLAPSLVHLGNTIFSGTSGNVVLQNVKASAAIITSGNLAHARLPSTISSKINSSSQWVLPFVNSGGGTHISSSGVADFNTYKSNGTKVIGNQGSAVSDASGGSTQDAEARTAINTLLSRLRSHGLIA